MGLNKFPSWQAEQPEKDRSLSEKKSGLTCYIFWRLEMLQIPGISLEFYLGPCWATDLGIPFTFCPRESTKKPVQFKTIESIEIIPQNNPQYII